MKKKLDLNHLAKSNVEQATGESAPENHDNKKTAQAKGRNKDNNKSKNQLPSVKSNS